MNEFAYDNSNQLFRVYIETSKLKNSIEKIKYEKRYLLISDSMIMIFAPYPISKNLGELLFYSHIYLIEDIKTLQLDEDVEKKIKKKENLKEENFKKFYFTWKKSDDNIPNNSFMRFDYSIVTKIDSFFHLNDKISHRRKKLQQTFELFSEDYHKFIPIEAMNIYDESKIVEIVMYQEKTYMKNFTNQTTNVHVKDLLLKQQAKEVIFLYNKLIDFMTYKNDESILIFRNKLKEFMDYTGYTGV